MSDKSQHTSVNNFQEVVEKYHPMVYKVCLGFVKNTTDAEDLTQEVFIKAYTSFGQFRKDAKLSSWIYRIAVNLCLNYIRDHRQRYFVEISSISDSVRNTDDTDQMMHQEDLQKILKYAISTLPEKQMKIYILSKYEDLSVKEIANILNCSISSIEVSIHRANKALKKKLMTYYEKNYLKM